MYIYAVYFRHMAQDKMSDSSSLDSEVKHCIEAASSAFGRLKKRVFLNHNLAIPTKVAVYRAVCVSVMLYGCETWTSIDDTSRPSRHFTSAVCKASLASDGGRKYHTLSSSAEHLLLERQLRWLGHVIGMPDNRLPRRLLYGELTVGQRSVGRPKKRFIDHAHQSKYPQVQH